MGFQVNVDLQEFQDCRERKDQGETLATMDCLDPEETQAPLDKLSLLSKTVTLQIPLCRLTTEREHQAAHLDSKGRGDHQDLKEGGDLQVPTDKMDQRVLPEIGAPLARLEQLDLQDHVEKMERGARLDQLVILESEANLETRVRLVRLDHRDPWGPRDLPGILGCKVLPERMGKMEKQAIPETPAQSDHQEILVHKEFKVRPERSGPLDHQGQTETQESQVARELVV